jgi:hypothetical protein
MVALGELLLENFLFLGGYLFFSPKVILDVLSLWLN